MANVLYNEAYDGWNPNRTIRKFDPLVQYGIEDYAIDIPVHTEIPPPKLKPVKNDASWVADDSCFPTPPPPSTAVTSAVEPADGVTTTGAATSAGTPNFGSTIHSASKNGQSTRHTDDMEAYANGGHKSASLKVILLLRHFEKQIENLCMA
ncbi:hypothetical protein RvY_01913 [Ramazzottius varieornatus]|uniref:Uncharacterized protein n=1 Tax=Ramazzottius varieornatus TaxID=947166 RepID=A0A1D1UI31_RAMVA|nr:hypothetical protein RvY_01913 [Ramazzottius varieornatus]